MDNQESEAVRVIHEIAKEGREAAKGFKIILSKPDERNSDE